MKTYVQNLALLSAVIAFGCNSNKTEPQADQEQNQSVTTETDTIHKTATGQTAETKVVEGVVKSINPGKDGYTALIETKSDGVYSATISHSNLNDPKQYRSFNKDEIVKVSGEYWKMGTENQLTVREIL